MIGDGTTEGATDPGNDGAISTGKGGATDCSSVVLAAVVVAVVSAVSFGTTADSAGVTVTVSGTEITEGTDSDGVDGEADDVATTGAAVTTDVAVASLANESVTGTVAASAAAACCCCALSFGESGGEDATDGTTEGATDGTTDDDREEGREERGEAAAEEGIDVDAAAAGRVTHENSFFVNNVFARASSSAPLNLTAPPLTH